MISGAIPSRVVFMTTLETTKAATLKLTEKLDVSEAVAAAIANGAAGLISSMASQTVFVPLDVVGFLLSLFNPLSLQKDLIELVKDFLWEFHSNMGLFYLSRLCAAIRSCNL